MVNKTKFRLISVLKLFLLVEIIATSLFGCSSQGQDSSLLSVAVKSSIPVSGQTLQHYEDQLQQLNNDNIRLKLVHIWAGQYLDAQKSLVYVEKRSNIDDSIFDGIFIFDRVPGDDSVSGYRYDIQLKANADKFEIVKLDESWRCWPDRGHQYFSADPCQ